MIKTKIFVYFYLETSGVLKEIFFEKDLRSSQIGKMRTCARSHHDAALDFKCRCANVLKLDDSRIVGIAPRIEKILSSITIDGDGWIGVVFGHVDVGRCADDVG